MNQFFKTTLVLGLMSMTIVTGYSKAKPPFELKSELSPTIFHVGEEIKPQVYLQNVSGKSIPIKYLRPWLIMPELIDRSTMKPVLDGPYGTFDLVTAMEDRSVPVDGKVQLSAPSILLLHERNEKPRGRLQEHWIPRAGNYEMRFSFRLKEIVPDQEGISLEAKPLVFSIEP